MSKIYTFDIIANIATKVRFEVEAHDEDEADELASVYLEDHLEELASDAADSSNFDLSDAEVISIVAQDNGEDEEDDIEDDWDREQHQAGLDDIADDQRKESRFDESLILILNKVNKVK